MLMKTKYLRYNRVRFSTFDGNKTLMHFIVANPVWGFHLNDSNYCISSPPCPKWAKSFDQQDWNKLGVVVWVAEIQRVTHLFGSQAMHILKESRKSKVWRKKGLVVGEIVYRITMPADKKSKGILSELSIKKDGWCLSNTIQLSPSQSKQFLSYLEQNEAKLKEIIVKENEERGRLLGKAYSLILSWRRERKAKEALITPNEKQDPKLPENNGISIPQGKYYTLAQVAEICGVTARTVTTWVKKEKLYGIDLPGMGLIVGDKELARFIKENRQQLVR